MISIFLKTGYIDHSLSEFNTTDFGHWRDSNASEICQYRGYRLVANSIPIHFRRTIDDIQLNNISNRISRRNPWNVTDPDKPEERYTYSPHYWHVFAARLAFVVVFEVRFLCAKLKVRNFITFFIAAHCIYPDWNHAIHYSGHSG